MTKVRIELDQAGIAALLRSGDVAADLERRAAAVAQQAGPGIAHRVYQGRDRVRAVIWTATAEARLAEARERNLLRALDAARR